jgi:hypothetical protein
MILKQNFILVFIPFLDLGELCYEADNVSYIQNAECRGSLTRCKAPFIIAENNRECRYGEVQTMDVIITLRKQERSSFNFGGGGGMSKY